MNKKQTKSTLVISRPYMFSPCHKAEQKVAIDARTQDHVE